MSDIYEYIGKKIRELRTTFKGSGISQAELARRMATTPNTVSRWETAVYKPSIYDLENLATLFGVPITSFFPQAHSPSRVDALLSATRDLEEGDLNEVVRFALFRRATASLKK